MGVKILTEIFVSRLRKREGLEDMELHLQRTSVRLDIRTFLFSQRTVNEWNRLSADFVDVSSVNMFENKINIYLRWRDTLR